MKVKKESKMAAGDPLGKYITQCNEINFVKLHSPKMKSVYWRYFGFPTNENDRIITKQNVVCTLCHKVLTNHGNTTNLRAHLQHRHKDIFRMMCDENGIKIPPRKPTPRSLIKREPSVEYPRIKVEFHRPAPDSSNGGNDDQSMLYETMVPMTYEDDEVIDADHFAKVEVSGALATMKNISDMVDESDPYQLNESLVNLLMSDMRSVDTLYDPGMTQFIRAMSGVIAIPSEKKIEALIRQLHTEKLTALGDQIKLNSQLKPFSLGFEIWTNSEQKHFLSIYYNYTTEAPQYNLLNQLYSTFEYNKFTSIDTIFEDFNLKNCTAAIVSYDCDDYLKHFLTNKRIPIILSYDAVVDKCLRNVFALPSVTSIIEQVKEVIMRYTTEINSKEVELPSFSEEFPWTQYDLLKFFSESVSWPEDVDLLVASAKMITEILSPLAVTLDTLKGEEIPHSSMLSPVTSKILNKKFIITPQDDEFVISMKSTVVSELQKLVIEDDHLTIAALLDPRFHRLTNLENLSDCIKILKDKYFEMRKGEGFESTAPKRTIKPSSSNARKSNLELFFDLQESSSSDTPYEDCNVESDLKRYRNEVYVSLDESPFVWWNKVGHMYGSLKQLAILYQCVPCVVNMNFKKPVKQQVNEYHKRHMLAGSLVDAILFLHHNGK